LSSSKGVLIAAIHCSYQTIS